MPRSSTKNKRLEEARRLRRLREILGYSQRELARQFQVAHGAVGLWENGERTIPGPVLKLLALYEEELGMDGSEKSQRTLEALSTSWAARSLKLSRTTLGVTARLAGSALENIMANREDRGTIRAATQAAIARQMVSSLDEMKGFAMKLGQMVSYVDFAMPEVARDVLSTLQASSTPMSPSIAANVVLEELGDSPRALFKEWTPEPFAAASIGQVHRARLHSGESVAVKVQYPGIARTVEADLKNASMVDTLGSLILRGQGRGEIVAELRERFLEECDYRQERANQEEFARVYAGRPEIVIPRVFPELSSRRVLTMEFIEGRSFKTFRAEASQEEKNRAGEQLFRFAFESIFRHGFFNADPHPGNYLFLEDGRIAFLDFGCVKRFSPALVTAWRELLRSKLERDTARADAVFQKLGMISDVKGYDFEAHHRMLNALYEPWLFEGEFTFTSEYVRRTWLHMAAKNPNKFRLNMPKDWLFTNRLQWGLYAILSSLDATFDCRSAMLELLYDKGEAWPAPYSARDLV